MEKQKCQTWPEAGSEPVASGGHYPIEQVKAHHPEKIVAGYIVAWGFQVLHLSSLKLSEYASSRASP